MITLTPAYGRDYETSKAVMADLLGGKDFILVDMYSRWNGKPTTLKEVIRYYDPTIEVRVRFHRLRKTIETSVGSLRNVLETPREHWHETTW